MKNILFSFLSFIHLDNGSFVSTTYEKKYKCIQTNESAVEYLMDVLAEQGETLDALFYFSSRKTKEKLCFLFDGKAEAHTHEEWFKMRIMEKFPALTEDDFYAVDYDEEKDTNESILQIIPMTEKIKKFIADNPGIQVRLHADMTGGFRHASMMMLSVMQLLRTEQFLEIGKVVYSNWQRRIIEDVTEVHRMYTLVSGADEFVNFGSVTEIDKYFESKPELSEKLDKLLNTMRRFSYAVKICRTNKIEEYVKQLRKRINEFKDEPGKPIREEIFSQIISLISKEYGVLLSSSATRTDIIRWCIKKGFLQQAMTLCTEWLPEMLVDKKICYTDDAMRKLNAEKQGMDMNQNWKQAFIISYNEKNRYSKQGASVQPVSQEGLNKALADFTAGKNIAECAEAVPEAKQFLIPFFTECRKHANIFQRIKGIDAKHKKLRIFEFKQIAPLMERACRIEWRRNVIQDVNYKDSFEQLIERIQNVDGLMARLANLPDEYYCMLLNVEKKVKNKKTETVFQDDNYKWQARALQYEAMFKAGIMETKYPDKAMDLLKGYFDIRVERNHINHANGDGLSGEESRTPIDVMMLNYLDKLQRI